MQSQLKVLIVEDVPTDAELALRELKRAGIAYEMVRVETKAVFLRKLEEFKPDLIISDFSLPEFDGKSALALAKEICPDTPFILVSGTIGEETAVESLKSGATDYILKGNLMRLAPAVRRALQDKQERAARRQAEQEIVQQREFFRKVIDLDRNRIFAKDREGRFTLVNQTFAEAYGCSVEDMLGKTNADFNPDQKQAERFKKFDLEVMNTLREVFIPEEPFTNANGEVRWLQVVKRPLISADGKANMVLGVATDITERKLQEENITRLSRIHEVMSRINSLIVRVRDRRELLTEVCRIAVEHGKFELVWIGLLDQERQQVQAVAWAGFSPETAHAISWASIISARGTLGEVIVTRKPAVRDDIENELPAGLLRREALEQGSRSTVCMPFVVDNKVVAAAMFFAPGQGFFDKAEMALLTELAGDISFALDHIEKEEKLNYLAYYDALTGLPNRTFLHERLAHEVLSAKQDGRKVAVLMVDVKRFSQINQTLGRQAGDALLREFAERFRCFWPDPDNVARITADCFAGILSNVKEASEIAHLLGKPLADSLSQPFAVGGKELTISITAGIALFPADGQDADTLLRNAEAALKKAKTAGEGYLFYEPRMNATVAQTLLLENKLRRALEREEFVLHYQPKVNLGTGSIVGLEALIRWNDPDTGLVPPAQFIPLLEETGLILDVGRWAIRQALADYREWGSQGLQPPCIAVNVSPIQLRQKDFVEVVSDAIRESKSMPHGLDLELTESLIMEDIAGNIQKLKALRDMGINIAIDDFGTGYSSLGYLARLPINTLKIDRSFIITMTDEPDSMTIVSMIISLAHSLNLKVVAEGVETEEQSRFLKLLKCDELQGYIFSKPLPVEQLTKMLEERRES